MKLHALLTILFAVSVKAQSDRTARPRSAICAVQGEPHYTSFDGIDFDWQGLCRYNLASYCVGDGSKPLFQVFSENENRKGFPAVSWPLYVEIIYNGDIIRLRKAGPPLVNGVAQPSLPYYSLSGSYSIVTNLGYTVFAATTIPLQVSFDNGFSVIVQIGGIFANKVCGLCGNFDGVSANDWAKPDSTIAANGELLGDSWVVPGQRGCAYREDPFPGPPAVLPISDDVAAVCAILSDPKGVLGALVNLTSDDDRKLNQFNCQLDAGYSKGRSAPYSLRHFAMVKNMENNNILDLSKALDGFKFLPESQD